MDGASRFFVRWKLVLFVLPVVLIAAAVVASETSLALSALLVLAATASVVYLFTDYVSESL